MQSIKAGLLGGFIGTIAMCGMMIAKTASGRFPELHIIRTLSDVLGTSHYGVAILVMFFIGTVVWGGLFALASDRMPGRSCLLKGLIFGVLAWLAMMVILMPLAGAGFFAIGRGTWTVPVVSLVYHLVFGAVLGMVYDASVGAAPLPDRHRDDIAHQ